jgi:hypothetical protein
VETFFKRAVAAEAKIAMPLDDTFWGDRYGKLEDPFGHHWSVATHVRDVKPEELREAAKKACGEEPVNIPHGGGLCKSRATSPLPREIRKHTSAI